MQEALATPKEADDNLAQREQWSDPGELEL